jgi:hypothetical protein
VGRFSFVGLYKQYSLCILLDDCHCREHISRRICLLVNIVR